MNRTRFIAGAVALVVCLGGVAAFAYFTQSGSGPGSAHTGTLLPVTVSAVAGGDTPSSKLIPGGSADVILRVNNTNAFAVTLVTVTGGPGAISTDGSHPTCTTTGVTFNNQSGLSTTIAASGTTLVHLPGAASMSAASLSSCQGATFSVPVTITVQK